MRLVSEDFVFLMKKSLDKKCYFMRTYPLSIFILMLLFGFQNIKAQNNQSNTLLIDVTSNQKVISRSIDKNLLLRVVKESSASQKNFGWRLEVVRKPYRINSANLVYHKKMATRSAPSQIYAWHISDNYFPNEREIKVRGYRFVVKIELINCQTEGSGPDGRFISGKLKVSWHSKS